MSVKINTDPRPNEVEEVWFGDDGPYVFTTPKIAPLLAAMRRMNTASDAELGDIALDTQDEWLAAGFGEEQWNRIQGRIADPEDPLDTWHLMEVFEELFRQAAGRPPTSLGGLSGTSLTPPSGGSPRHSGSTRTISRPSGRVI